MSVHHWLYHGLGRKQGSVALLAQLERSTPDSVSFSSTQHLLQCLHDRGCKLDVLYTPAPGMTQIIKVIHFLSLLSSLSVPPSHRWPWLKTGKYEHCQLVCKAKVDFLFLNLYGFPPFFLYFVFLTNQSINSCKHSIIEMQCGGSLNYATLLAQHNTTPYSTTLHYATLWLS